MDWTVVKSQAEFDAAIAARQYCISLEAKICVDVRLQKDVVVVVKAIAGAFFKARDSSHVVAWDSSHVVARGSSHVVARDSSHVVARDSSHVEACGSASLSLFRAGVTAKATAMVAVQLHLGAKCNGGQQIKIKAPKTPREWCDYYGAEIDGDTAILFKAVDNTFTSQRGATYTPGTLTVAPDWDGPARECGGGLHFCSTPSGSKAFHPGATKFVCCRVPLKKIVIHPNGQYPHKIKAQECWNAYECDQYGKRIGEEFIQPKQRTTKRAKTKK